MSRVGLAALATACAITSCTSSPSGGEYSDEIETLELELTIGDDLAAAAEYQFAWIRDIVVDHSARIWVLDAGGSGLTSQNALVRQYEADGAYTRQVGSHGEGPGEYLDPRGLALLPDGRAALRDFGLPDRLTLYAGGGSLDTI